jgi:hypothetical protein
LTNSPSETTTKGRKEVFIELRDKRRPLPFQSKARIVRKVKPVNG